MRHRGAVGSWRGLGNSWTGRLDRANRFSLASNSTARTLKGKDAKPEWARTFLPPFETPSSPTAKDAPKHDLRASFGTVSRTRRSRRNARESTQRQRRAATFAAGAPSTELNAPPQYSVP